MATTALSFTASFGLSSLLWRHGLGYVGVESVIPIYIFISLGVDYNIFLPARIREESRRPGLHGGTNVLHVPGGPGQEALMDDSEVLGWLSDQAAGGSRVFSVCTGALLLGAAGTTRPSHAMLVRRNDRL